MLPVSGPWLGEAEIAAVGRVIRSGYLGMGEETQRFEEEVAAFLGGGPVVVATSSGTSALHLACFALGLGPGDEVLVPSLTFVATFQAVLACGARPVPCDVRLEDGLLDLEDARRRITSRTRAVIPVHYAGHVGDLEAVYALARANGLRVVEDAAHAFGTRYIGARVGSIGDVVCFSFDPIKTVTTGEGGAVVTRDPRVADRVRAGRRLGLASPVRTTTSSPAEAPVTPDDVEVTGPGWRYHMPNLAAAIGRVQLARFDDELGPRRVALARRYRERLEGLRRLRLLASTEEVVPHLFVVRVLDGQRDAVRQRLAECGFASAIHYKPNHLHSLFRTAEPLPAAERLYGEIVSLPLHSSVSEADVTAIVDVLRRLVA